MKGDRGAERQGIAGEQPCSCNLSPAPCPRCTAFLLGRAPRTIPVEEGENQIAGARALVTGAGGSVGSALVSRLAALQPEQIIALDNHEASLFRLSRDLAPGTPIQLRLADVRNAEKVKRILCESRPAMVFHLAAYKHVPFGELEPDEPIGVNILGTHAIASAAVEAGVRQLVYPSSDKAVNPPSLYGATKRLAETMLLALAERQATTSIHVVRYVNIMGTSGSALETFIHQARVGEPLTLTDPRMTRYWMGMDEAMALLWHALALPSGSRTLLDVGEAIPVRTMGERIYALLRGQCSSPEFVATGPRPGERLAEELASASETLVACGGSSVRRVLHARSAEHTRILPAMVEEIAALLRTGAIEPLRARVMEFARRLQ